ncbi:MAG TPA: hypothetical protein VF712_10765 [Thermoleophilaceae bacterium]|jgi:uncharacterized ferredoxin-like protein
MTGVFATAERAATIREIEQQLAELGFDPAEAMQAFSDAIDGLADAALEDFLRDDDDALEAWRAMALAFLMRGAVVGINVERMTVRSCAVADRAATEGR